MADVAEPRGAGAAGAGFGDRLRRLAEWSRALTTEVVALPETLRSLREGATNFELVAKRLSRSSDALEQVTELYEATLAESARQSADAAQAVRAQIDALTAAGSPERVISALGEVQRMMESMAELNPFWPTTRRPPENTD